MNHVCTVLEQCSALLEVPLEGIELDSLAPTLWMLRSQLLQRTSLVGQQLAGIVDVGIVEADNSSVLDVAWPSQPTHELGDRDVAAPAPPAQEFNWPRLVFGALARDALASGLARLTEADGSDVATSFQTAQEFFCAASMAHNIRGTVQALIALKSCASTPSRPLVRATIQGSLRIVRDALVFRCLLYTSPSPRDRG